MDADIDIIDAEKNRYTTQRNNVKEMRISVKNVSNTHAIVLSINEIKTPWLHINFESLNL